MRLPSAGVRVAIGVAAACGLFVGPAAAQEIPAELQARMEREKADRHNCKVSICAAARNKVAEGQDISCSVVKTWTVEELKDKILKGSFSWPWGHAQCKADIKLDRKTLAQVLGGGTIEAKLAKHVVSCTLDQQTGTDKYAISFAIQPKVAFAAAKATKVTLNWSDIEGAALAKGAVWSAAQLDNNLGILEGSVVEVINDFFEAKCDEVKGELGK